MNQHHLISDSMPVRRLQTKWRPENFEIFVRAGVYQGLSAEQMASAWGVPLEAVEREVAAVRHG